MIRSFMLPLGFRLVNSPSFLRRSEALKDLPVRTKNSQASRARSVVDEDKEFYSGEEYIEKLVNAFNPVDDDDFDEEEDRDSDLQFVSEQPIVAPKTPSRLSPTAKGQQRAVSDAEVNTPSRWK
ncbi:unnamed protein product [Clonostachys byssicola]|uniref:Uncharacterized protein n=1 Tax=Clonostachys byssicola TaxID=160290 RepID=A0A9N9UDB5_9HYPO|nr:unnamed protein product [Clonostachys byssicola]